MKNHKEVLDALFNAGYDVQYTPNFDGMSTVEQMQYMSEVDILIGPHGKQFINVLYQPECGSLLELFGENYYMPQFFGSLAAASGKHHFYIYNGGPNANENLNKARHVLLFETNPQVVVQLTHQMVEKWQVCCKSGFRVGESLMPAPRPSTPTDPHLQLPPSALPLITTGGSSPMPEKQPS